MRLIILPQALKIVIPGIVNIFIGLFKDTTLVLIIGLFDFLGTVQAGMQPIPWAGAGIPIEGYVFAAFVYWCLLFRHVALQHAGSSAGSTPASGTEPERRRGRSMAEAAVEQAVASAAAMRRCHRVDRRPQVVRRVPRAQGHQPRRLRKGERIVICGPSGSGKSTMIRCINRLEEHQRRPDRRRRHRAHQRRQERSTRSAAKSAWCSSTSTCSRT